ncbi:MAG: DUF1998 domain-containing protein [Opitutales bacterium]|nr:DUF1998 domain-containing protein [Opitutales bacterium]
MALSDICPRSNCRGKLVLGLPQNSEYNKENHYINLYTCENPLHTMQVREHSAALTTKEREELESKFKSFDVNILSCTTTMEMGIDLGDLSAVLLRNLPPDISNYQQRVGRAGRRGQATPVAVTILRNRRFDLLVGKNIQGDFLLKQPSMPIVKIQNPVILRRHQNALILAEYLKEKGIGAEDPKKSITLEMLFENTGAHHDVPQAGIQNAIKLAKTIFPFQFKFEESEDLTNEKVVVQNFVTDFEFARKKYESLRDELENDWKNLCEQRKSSDGVLKTLKNLKSKLIIEFLSKNGVLPTYSFPVDNVELLLGESRFDSNSITRDATVGINEYAPGASIVANGKEWVSQGVKVGAKEFLETRLYRICKFCGKIDSVQAELGNTSLASQKLGTICSRCGKNPQSRNKIYIVPKTFYTKESGRPKTSRVIPPLAMEVKLIASWEAEDFENWGDVKTLLVPAQKGEMVKINQGCKWRFYRNRSTGEMKRKLKQFEKSPKGFRSDAVVDLAHQFRCDVLLIKIKSSEIKEAGFLETLVETLRIGAAKYLNINEQELGSSIETINVDGYDEISIFDNVSGGAGYVASCTKKIPQLFESARRVINCECESGCLKCLRSYSNQHYWDFFSRESKDAVRSFLERVRTG